MKSRDPLFAADGRRADAWVIFDLDGTLWDASRSAAPVWNAVLARFGKAPCVTHDGARALMGADMEETAAALLPHLSAEDRALVRGAFEAEEVRYLGEHGAVLYPGVPETLRALSLRYPLAVVSNAQDGYIEAFFRAHGLGAYFRDHASSGGTGLGKAANIRLVMDRNAARAAVYVGDTHRDEEAARGAGIPFIHAAYGFGTAERPDAAVARPDELPAALEPLLKGGPP